MNGSSRYRIGQAVFEAARGVLVDAVGQPVALRAQSMQVLEVLVAQGGAVVSRDVLQRTVWPDVVVTDDSLIQCIGDIRRAIGDSRHEVLRTVARRGYALEVEPLPDLPPPASPQTAQIHGERATLSPTSTLTSTPTPPTWSRKPNPARRKLAYLAALVLAAVVAVAVWWPQAESPAPLDDAGTFGARPALAVLAFRTEPTGDDSGLGTSIAEELIGDLARDVDLPVVSGRSSFLLDAARLTPQDIARQLTVRYLVDGVVRREGDELVVRVQLIDGSDGRIVWVDDSRATVDKLSVQRAALIERIAGSVASTMRLSEKRKALRRPAETLDAYALTLRAYAGKHQFTPDAYLAARKDLDEALRIDPQHAPAWAVLGYLNAVDATIRITGEWSRQRIGEALAQIDRAIELDPTLPVAYQARAVALSVAGRYVEARGAAETSVRLAPGDADNHAVLAKVQLESGRLDDAVASIGKALPLYPILPVYVSYWEANIRWATRDLDGALAKTDYCLERVPRFLPCRLVRAVTLVELGRMDDARQEAQAIQRAVPTANDTLFVSSLGDVEALKERRVRAANLLGFAAGG